jgi:hypothetical protein
MRYALIVWESDPVSYILIRSQDFTTIGTFDAQRIHFETNTSPFRLGPRRCKRTTTTET